MSKIGFVMNSFDNILFISVEFLLFNLDKNLKICNDFIVLILCEYWFKNFSINGQSNINSSNILDSLIFQIYVCLP